MGETLSLNPPRGSRYSLVTTHKRVCMSCEGFIATAKPNEPTLRVTLELLLFLLHFTAAVCQ